MTVTVILALAAPAAVAAQRPTSTPTRLPVISPARSQALGPRSVPSTAWSGDRRAPTTRRRSSPLPLPCAPWCPLPFAYGGTVVAAPVVILDGGYEDRTRAYRRPTEDCALIEVHADGRRWLVPVALPALGARTPDDLFAAIADELGSGRQVSLRMLDGTRVVIPAGPGVRGLVVEACGP